jgi:hypothetical protein
VAVPQLERFERSAGRATFAQSSITGERLIEMVEVRLKRIAHAGLALSSEALTQEVTDEFAA